MRLGVLGLGAMGRRHLSAARATSDLEVVGVADPSAGAHGQGADVPVVGSLGALLGMGVDACVVAAPSPQHLAAAIELAAAGVHVLMEKPLAMDVAECAQIVEAFAGTDAIVRVGHVERFNPALVALRNRLEHGELGDLLEIVTRREGGPPTRHDGGDVLLDLGTHDFDLVGWLTASPVRPVSVSASPIGCAPRSEAVRVELTLAHGLVTSHSFSWCAPQRVRTLAVRGTAGTLVADTLAGDLRSGRGESLGVPQRDPLTAQLQAWCDVIRGRLDPHDPRSGAGLLDGAQAVGVAGAVMAASGDRP
ncbi:MAG: Gfo/Idh/MocA family oxidoreductase [Acidimicrobiales bacterium]